MRRKYFFIALTLTAIMGTACTTTAGQKFDSTAIDQIKIGKTTTAQTRSTLGEPYSQNVASDGTETWKYFQLDGKNSTNAAGFLPVVGPFMSNVSSETQTKTLELNFENNVLKKCLFKIESSKSKEGIAWTTGSSSSSQSKEITCGQ